jgi:hypothetical protein
VTFTIIVTADQAAAVEARALEIYADRSSLAAAVEQEAIALGVSAEDAKVTIIQYEGLRMKTPTASYNLGGPSVAGYDDSTNLGIYVAAVAIGFAVVSLVTALYFRQRYLLALAEAKDSENDVPVNTDLEQPEMRKLAEENNLLNVLDSSEVVVSVDPVEDPKAWIRKSGYIPDGDDVHVAIMTVDEAKLAASNLVACQGCMGFCHAGPPTDEPVTIYFKAQSAHKSNVVKENALPWTSFLLQDTAIPMELDTASGMEVLDVVGIDGHDICAEFPDTIAI